MWRDILHLLWYFIFFTIWNYFLRHWIGRMQCYAEDLRCSLKLYFHHWEQQQTTYLLYASEQIVQPLSTFFTLGTLEISSESTHRCTFSYQTSQIFGSHSKVVLNVYLAWISCLYQYNKSAHTQMNREIVMLSGINSFNQKYFIVQLICFNFCFKNTDHVLGFVWSWCHPSLIGTAHLPRQHFSIMSKVCSDVSIHWSECSGASVFQSLDPSYADVTTTLQLAPSSCQPSQMAAVYE